MPIADSTGYDSVSAGVPTREMTMNQKKTYPLRKLHLDKEQIRTLTPKDLRGIPGGGSDNKMPCSDACQLQNATRAFPS
jgi:hypothetical protein